jgi:hypothetical protein
MAAWLDPLGFERALRRDKAVLERAHVGGHFIPGRPYIRTPGVEA